jgi:nucleotide-binding universal stress UspA family protein
MYKKVLSAINEHLNSEISARYALNLAKVSGAKFYLCFIAEKKLPQSDFERAEEAMKRLFLEAEEMNVQVESITVTGDTVREIEKIVRHEGINIVFTATRREDIRRKFYVGTVARSLSLYLPCSVALVRVVHMGKIHPHKILVPIKSKINHLRERSYFTAKMAEIFSSKVFVFHTTKPLTKFFHGEIHLTPAQWEKRLPKSISDFIEHLKKYNIELEGKFVSGSTARNV